MNNEQFNNYNNIPKEKFDFANKGEKLLDKKFDTKPIGYFKDAFIRFCKNKASVVASIIIGIIILYAFIVPLCSSDHAKTLMDTYYAKKGPRIESLKNSLNICNGGSDKEYNEQAYIFEIAKAVATDTSKNMTIAEAKESEFYSINKVKSIEEQKQGSRTTLIYTCNIDTYLSVGFIYRSVEQDEYQKILDWQNETGIQVIYPLINNNEYCFSYDDKDNAANYWYKTSGKLVPVTTKSGTAKALSLSDDLVLEDNYRRDESGNLVYWEYTGGGDVSSAQYKIRVLYYNYYQYLNGFKPNYLLGTDSQGYDMAVRLANGIKLSLLVSICVSVINFILGAMYGAVEGYYGGAIDLTLERISDILAGIPFVIVATLFQMHWAAKLGPVACLIFAYIITGWIGTASRVRTQFYRFKNQEYVMAARTLGARDRRIIWKHIFPNTLGTIITSSVLVIPGAIFTESMLSYLGIVNLGGKTTTSLGTLLSESSNIWTKYPHLMICPALIIALLMICFNLFGNGLRDAFNPTLRGVEE